MICLVLAIEAKVGCQQTLFRCVPSVPPAAKVEKQPAQIECGKNLVQGCAKETAGGDILGCRESLTLITSKRRQCEHGEVFALDQSKPNRGLACRFPRDARLGVHAFSDVDKLDNVVTLLRVDG